MKKLFYTGALLLATSLCGCSNELGSPETNPDYLEPGTSMLHVSIDLPQPQGYAVGDPDTGASTPEEKEIKSLAFFVKTSHAFGKYFSEEQPLSPNGFTQALQEATPGIPGTYTASFKVRSVKFLGDTEVIAIANYKENNLDFSKVTTMKALKQMLTQALDGTKNLEAPLLMYAQNAAVTLRDKDEIALALVMERMVARVDVINQAESADALHPDDGFTLQSVRLLNAPMESSLIPELGQTFGGVDLPSRAVVGTEAFVKCTYLYETPNDAKENQPRIEVKGTFRGTPVLKEIPFKTADLPGAPGTYFPIRRNYRYIVNILPADKVEDLEFVMSVKEWTEGEIIQVKPSMKAPKLENFRFSADEAALTAAGLTWDETTATLTMTRDLTDDITLTFEASAFQAPKYSIFADVDNVTFITAANVKADEVIGYADDPVVEETPDANEPMPLKRTFTLTLPKVVETLVPEGSTHTNVLRILVTEAFATPVTVVYKDQRTPAVAP